MNIHNMHSAIIALIVASAICVGTSGLVAAGGHWSGARDSEAPAVTIVGVPKMTDKPFNVTFVFTERVSGFDLMSDVLVTNAKLSGFKTGAKKYQVRVAPTGKGDVQITVTAHSASDFALNTGPITDVSVTVSVSSKKSTEPDGNQKLKQAVKDLKRIKELADAPNAQELRRRAAENVKSGNAPLLVEPPRITREDESHVDFN